MDIIRQKVVITRKDHNCFGCARKFKKGSELNSITTVDGGDIETNYWCRVCDWYWTKYMESGDLIGYGELKSEDKERWELLREEIESVIKKCKQCGNFDELNKEGICIECNEFNYYAKDNSEVH